MTNSTKTAARQYGDAAQKAITSEPVSLSTADIKVQYESPFPKEDNLGRLTKILLTAAGISTIEVKQQSLTLDEATRPNGLLPALLAGPSGPAWETDLAKDDSALLGYKVQLGGEHDLLERVQMIHDNVQTLFRAGAVKGEQQCLLCIDILVGEGELKDFGEAVPDQLGLQSSNLSVARDAIYKASSQVSLHHAQSSKLQ